MRNFTFKKTDLILLSITSIYGFSFTLNSFAQNKNNIITKPDRLLEIGEEQIDSNEDNIAEQISKMFQEIVKKGYASRPGDARPARRDAHAKHHGCAIGKFIVENKLPMEFQKGVFATPKEYKAFIRFSNGSFDLKADKIPDAHGVAIKLIGVKSNLLNETETNGEDNTQDFIMIDNPVFFMRNAESYISLFIAQSKGPEAMKEWMKEHPYEAKIIFDSLNKRNPSPISAQYWSQTPYKFGENSAIKFTIKPCKNQTFITIPENKRGPDYLKETLAKHLKRKNACYDFFIIPQKDSQAMPIEDSTIEWTPSWNGKNNIFKVATLILPKEQQPDSDKAMKFCEDLSFTPWHGTEEMRPLGGVNRARKIVYLETSNLRHSLNNVKQALPTEEIWDSFLLK